MQSVSGTILLLRSIERGCRYSRVPTDLRETVYCAGVADGGAAEWTFLWDKFRAEPVAAERWSLIAGLACTRNKATLFR